MTSDVRIAVGDTVQITDNCESSKRGQTGKIRAPHWDNPGYWHIEFGDSADRLVFNESEFRAVNPKVDGVQSDPEPLTYAEGYQDGAELADKLTLRITELGVELAELRKSLARNDREMDFLIDHLHNKLGSLKAAKLIRKAFRDAS
jgi:hypothetical protein